MTQMNRSTVTATVVKTERIHIQDTYQMTQMNRSTVTATVVKTEPLENTLTK